MGKQPTTFRIEGAASVVSYPDVESFFDKLHEQVALNFAFAAIGMPESTAFLINLKKKATLESVEKAVERALGSQYTAEAVERTKGGQRFVPGERQNEGRCKATIEIEAASAAATAAHLGDSPAEFILVCLKHRATYSYNAQAGLVKVSQEKRTGRLLGKGNPVPSGKQAGVASGLVTPHPQVLPLSENLPAAEFSSGVHGCSLNGQVGVGGRGGGGGGGGGEGNHGGCMPIGDRPDESLPPQSFPGSGGGGREQHEHSSSLGQSRLSVAAAARTVTTSLRGPALGSQGVNEMNVGNGGWDGELLPCIDWRVGFGNLPDGSNGHDDEEKDGREKGRTMDVVGAAVTAPAPATAHPERPEKRLKCPRRIPVSSLSSGVSSTGSNTSCHEFDKGGGSTSSFRPESEGLPKSAVHEALEPERRQLTRPQSVRDFGPVMNGDWEEGGRSVMDIERLGLQFQFDTITAVRQMLSTGRDPSFHVPKLVEFVLNEDDPALQLESARLLAMISGSYTHAVVRHGAVSIFVQLLTSANDDIREEAVRALGHIADHSPLSRDMVFQRGALGPLLQQLTDRSKLSMQRIATWALSKFCDEISSPRLEQVGPALPILARLIHSVDEEVLRNVCTTLRYLCAPGPEAMPEVIFFVGSGAHGRMVQAVVGAGVCQRLVELLDHASPAVHLEVLWAMHGIVSSEDQHTQELIKSNVLPRLHHLLRSSHQRLREKTCQVICRITTGNKEQIKSVIEAGIVPALIKLLADVNSDVRRHAASAISKVTKLGEPEEVKGWIPLLLSLFGNNNTQVILRVLEILEKLFLKVVPDSDAWRRLRHLLSSPDARTCEKTCQVIIYITTDNKKQTRAAIEAGIVPVLIKLLADANPHIRRYAASATSNVTELGEPEEVKGWIPLLLSLLENDDIQSILEVLEILGKFLKVVPDSDVWRRLRHLLGSSDDEVRKKTCDIIERITFNNKGQARAVIEAGIVPVLIKLLDDKDWVIRENAASAMSNVIEVCEPEEARGWIPLLLSHLENCDIEICYQVSEILENILKVVPDSDVWRRLRDLLSSSETAVREKTCELIYCITRGNKEQSRAVIDAGIVPVLIKLLDDMDWDIRQSTAWAMSDVIEVCEPEEARGWIPLLLSHLENCDIDSNYEVSKILENILKGVPFCDVLQPLRHLLSSSDTKVREKTCELIHGITNGNKGRCRAVIEAGIVPALIQFVGDANPDIHWNAASVSNVTEEDEPKEIKGWIPLLLGLLEINDKTQVIIRTLKILGIILQVVRDPDAWRRLRHLLSSSDTEVRSWACRVIRCVTNGNKEQSRAVIDAGIVPVLIQRLADVNFDIQWNAAPAISHVTEVGEPDEVRGWISLLLSLLENDDIQGDFVVSKTLEKILKVVPDSDAWRRLRDLLSSSETAVREKTCKLINWITTDNKEQARAAIEAGIVPALIQFVGDANPNIHWNAASVSNVTEEGGPEEVKGWIPLLLGLLEINDNTQVIIRTFEILEIILQVVRDSDAWRRLRHLLSSSDAKVREETCKLIRMVTKGNREQTLAAIEAGIVPVLIHLLADMDYAIRCRAASAISKVTKLSEPEEVRGWMPLLLSLLDNSNIATVSVLKVLEKILERGDTDAKAQEQEMNQMATYMTECGGWKHLECLERVGLYEGVDEMDSFDMSPKHKARELLRRFNNLADEYAQGGVESGPIV